MNFDLEKKVISYLEALKPAENNDGMHPILTKSELFKAVGLSKTNTEFNRIWIVLTKQQNSAYLVYQGEGKWMFFR